MAIYKVLAPTLRGFVEPALNTYFNQYRGIMTQQYHRKYINKDPQNSNALFNYGSVNGNESISKKWSKNWNFRIKDHHEFAKLYLSPSIAKFSNLGDKSCDVSALLTILSASGYFTLPQQDAAKAMKGDARNQWAHCNLDLWDANMYLDCFQLMKNLVRSLELGKEEETSVISDLELWEDKG